MSASGQLICVMQHADAVERDGMHGHAVAVNVRTHGAQQRSRARQRTLVWTKAQAARTWATAGRLIEAV